MDELREIVDIQSINRLFLILAVLLPLLGTLGGALWGAKASTKERGLRMGFVIGLLGPLNFLLWKTYNAITDHTGLDTVRNVVLNLVLFILVGVGLGIALRKWMQNHATKP